MFEIIKTKLFSNSNEEERTSLLNGKDEGEHDKYKLVYLVINWCTKSKALLGI